MADAVATARDIVDAFNEADWGRYEALMADGAFYNEIGTGRELRGAADIISALKGWRTAMPDVKGTITNTLADGDTAVLEITWEGTQTGPMEGPGGTIPPSGKRQKTPSTWVLEIENGKMESSRHYFDMLSFLTQIGAMEG